MNTLHMVRVRPEFTTGPVTAERVTAAWVAAHPVARRATVAACVTSAALGILAPVGTSTRAGIAVCGALLAAAALVDVHEHKLPNRLLAAAFAAMAVGVTVAADPALLGRLVAGLLLAGGLMLLVRLTRGVGMGDVKMAAVVGASTAPVVLIAAPIAVAVAAATAAGYGLMARRRRLALGPALWFGWAVALAAGIAGVLS